MAKGKNAPNPEDIFGKDAEKDALNRVDLGGGVADPSFIPEDVEVLNLAKQYANDDGVTLRIYKEGKGGYRDLTFMAEMKPDEFTPSLLQEEPYNGGRFRLHFCSRTGMIANKGLNVAPAPRHLVKNDTAITQLSERFDSLSGILRELVTRQTVPTPAPSRMELINEMRAMAELFNSRNNQPVPNNSVTNDPFAILRLMREFTEFQRSVSPSQPAVTNEKGELDSTATLINLADRFLGGLMQLKNNQQQPQNTNVSQIPQVAVIPENNLEKVDNNDMLTQMNAFLNVLCVQAAANGDVETYANIILDNVDEKSVLDFVNKPDWFETLVKANSNAGNYKSWFDELRTAILEMTQPDTVDGALTATPSTSSVPEPVTSDGSINAVREPK